MEVQLELGDNVDTKLELGDHVDAPVGGVADEEVEEDTLAVGGC